MTLAQVVAAILRGSNDVNSAKLTLELNGFHCEVEVRLLSVTNMKTGEGDVLQLPVGAYELDDVMSTEVH